MTVQFIDIGGEKLAVMPLAEYERLIDAAEDQADAEAAIAAEGRREAGEEYLPADMADRLLAGESPLRIWRNHRGFSLHSISEQAGMSVSYLSQMETGKREGTAKVWRRLAKVLDLDVDDILPHNFE